MTVGMELPTEGSFSFPLGKGLNNASMISPYLGSRGCGLYQYAEVRDIPSTKLGGSGVVTFYLRDKSYFIDATIKDFAGNVLVEIVDNHWRVFKNVVSKFNFDSSGLEVFDKTDRIVFSLDFRKASDINGLYVQVFTWYPDGYVDLFQSSTCFEHIKLEGPSPKTMLEFYDKTPIQPLFRYSGDHWQNARLATAN